MTKGQHKEPSEVQHKVLGVLLIKPELLESTLLLTEQLVALSRSLRRKTSSIESGTEENKHLDIFCQTLSLVQQLSTIC